MRKMMTVLALIAMLAIALPVFAEGPEEVRLEKVGTDVYVVIMAGDPAIAYDGGIEGLAGTRPVAGERFNSRSSAVQAYTQQLKLANNKVLQAVGAGEGDKIYDYTFSLNGFAAVLSQAQAVRISRQPGVVSVQKDKMKYPTTDSVGKFLGLTSPGGAWLNGYTGEDVVVGVIDTGIWPKHPSFADDGSYGPPPIELDDSERSACEFGNTAHNPADVAFECNNKLIGARQMLDTYRLYQGAESNEYDSARDDGGHGTHTASTAAGNAGVEATVLGIPRGTISGVAPRARIVSYKGLGSLGGYTSDLAAAIDQAVADGVDVINYSIGGGAGAPGADEIAFLFAADAGVFVATSAGNSGPEPATLGNPGTMPWLTTVGANTQNRFFGGAVVVGNVTNPPAALRGRPTFYGGRGHPNANGKSWLLGASITGGTMTLPLVDAEFAGGELCVPGELDPDVVAGKIVLCRRGVTARADKSRAVAMAGGAGMVLYNNSDDGDLASDSHWVPSVHVDLTPGLFIKAYIAASPTPKAKIMGGRNKRWPFGPTMTSFSSRGPNPVSGDIIKPDITAPGTHILAGYSPTSYDAYDFPGELFAAIQGTSMSSPIVAGVFALLKQAHPDWSPAMAKSAMMTTAHQDVGDSDRLTMADPFDFGAGHVNPGRRIKRLSMFNPGLAYDAGLFEYAAFTCGMEWGVFTPGSCAFLDSVGVPSEPYNLNYPSIGIAELPGELTVVRTVTNVSQENRRRAYRADVVAPQGYNVKVRPYVVHLSPGESATVEITITNRRAPIGEWRFGSLTWSSGIYQVRSPIAVRAAAFKAPAEILAAGEEGSTGFDVSFGYNGSYSAAAHGLEAATITSDNVVQDPDQDFDPNDGFSNLHQFDLSGAAYFRIAVPPEATEADADLDIFVYDPNGEQVATSTAGGTNELIDIVLPMDGTWSVFVHGWAAPGGDSDYDMYSWVISATPGGNMSVDSAPAAAALGATEAVDISWTGATAGEWHLGAISHTGDAGLMGLTLVNVDNR